MGEIALLVRPAFLYRTLVRIGPSRFVRTILMRLRQIMITTPLGPGDLRHAVSGLGRRGLARAVARGDFGEAIVLSARFDAFGGRLWNLLNASRVAAALGAQLRVYWPKRELDGISSAALVFDPEYLEKHRVDRVDLETCRNVTTWTLRDLAAVRKSKDTVWYEVRHRNSYFNKFDIATRGFRFQGLPTFAQAFESVRFHPDLERVRDAVMQLSRFDVAVHGRRGDIYSGDFRLGSHYVRKAIPLPLIDLILERYGGSGRALVVSNDDKRLRERLGCDVREIQIASDVLDVEDNELAQMFLDFCLLTRADRIVAGSSVFAILPALIGGGEVLPPEHALDTQSAASAVWEFVREATGTPDLEVALACTYLEDRLRETLSDSDRLELLGIAVEADLGNPSLVLAGTAECLGRGDEEAAERLFRRAVSAGVPEYSLRLVEHSFDIVRGVGFTAIDGGFLREPAWRTLEAAQERIPWAAFYVGLHRMALGQQEGARASLQRAMSLKEVDAVSEAWELHLRTRGMDPTPGGSGFSTGPGPEELNPRSGVDEE